MKLTIVRENERIELEGDDTLLSESCTYRAIFETTLTKTLEEFYKFIPSSNVTPRTIPCWGSNHSIPLNELKQG